MSQKICGQFLCKEFAKSMRVYMIHPDAIFRERQNSYSPQPAMTHTQLLLNNQHPICLTTEQLYQIAILNLYGNQNLLLWYRLDTQTVVSFSTFQLRQEIKFLYFCSPIVNLVLFINISPLHKVKLETLVEGDLNVPFSIATTPRCWGGCYSIPWIAPLYPWSLPYNSEC